MEKKTVYEPVYFTDEYHAQYEELRTRYRTRMEDAMKERSIDHSPVPNATTVVHLHEDSNGDMTIITTGDFVDFFNKKYGNSDRVGELRKSLELARIKADHCKEEQPARLEAMQHSAEKGLFYRVRTVKRHLIFTHVFFAMLLVFSIAMLSCSSLVLSRADERVMSLRGEVEVLRADAVGTTTTNEEILSFAGANETELSLCGESAVEFYEAETRGVEMSALLNALLGGK